MEKLARFAGVLVALSLVILAGLQGFASAQSQDKPSITLPLLQGSEPDIDGIWTSGSEWATAGQTMVNYTDNTRLVIWGVHDSDFIYVMLEMPDDHVMDGHGGICFDTLSDGGPYMNRDDYCYVMGSTLREYRGDGRTTLMQQAPLDQFVTAQRGLSDSKSPVYASSPHVSYEFKIPLDDLGSDNTQFGFYVSFDTRGQTNNYNFYYSWPDYNTAEYLRVASPRSWGTVSLSPDIEVPEFPVTVIGAIAAVIGGIAVLSRTRLIKI
jgi:hypothetical protein